MNWFFVFLSAAYVFAIFLLADSAVVSQIGGFNPYSLLHIPLYGILTLLILLSSWTGKEEYTKNRLFASGLIAGIVGAGDEFHQTFIPTRDGSLGDVFLDILGIVLAIFLFRLAFPFLRSKCFSQGKNA
jgi:VanZ family protein